MGEYRRGAQAVYDIKYHLVWITKYRYKVLRGRVAERTRDLIRQSCQAPMTKIEFDDQSIWRINERPEGKTQKGGKGTGTEGGQEPKGGVRSFGEARKEGTGCCSLRKACLCERIVARWQEPGKRKRALLESNPPRNTRLRTHRNDERGVRPPCRIPSSPTPDRIDRSAPAWKTPAALSRRPARRERFFELYGRHVP